MSRAVARSRPMVARIVRTGTRSRAGPAENEVTALLCPARRPGIPVGHNGSRSSPARAGARCGRLRGMTAPEPEDPQPRDIALEMETPELAADLEAQSDPADSPDES